jgi:Antibiotic biosynthesis monooxygenase
MMGVALEFVHLTVKAGQEEEFVLRRADVEAVLASMPGFLDAELVRLEDGTWLDLVHWASLEQAKAAAEQFPALTEVHPWAALMDEVKVMTHGEITNRTHGPAR